MAYGFSVRRAEKPEREPGHRGFLVEFVRLIVVLLFALGGWVVARDTGVDTPGRLLLGTVLGSAVGYVFGGMFGRRTATALSDLERELQRISAADALAGGIGLMMGLVVATLLSVPLFMFGLPLGASVPTVAFMYLTIAYGGYRIGRAKSEDLFGLFGVKPRAAGTRGGEIAVLDSSAILDERLMALVEMGFLSGTLIVPRAVLDELRLVADSSDPSRRARGRRGLDVLVSLKRDPTVDVVLIEDEPVNPREDVDSQLVRLARDRGGSLVTNDANLAKMASALEVSVRSIHALAAALRPVVSPGDQVSVRLLKAGKESGQAVGYLDDGSMVVVESAVQRVGDTVSVSVTNALQTNTGQLVFARLAGEQEGRAS